MVGGQNEEVDHEKNAIPRCHCRFGPGDVVRRGSPRRRAWRRYGRQLWRVRVLRGTTVSAEWLYRRISRCLGICSRALDEYAWFGFRSSWCFRICTRPQIQAPPALTPSLNVQNWRPPAVAASEASVASIWLTEAILHCEVRWAAIPGMRSIPIGRPIARPIVIVIVAMTVAPPPSLVIGRLIPTPGRVHRRTAVSVPVPPSTAAIGGLADR